MRRRLRVLLRPERSAPPPPPDLREALSAFALGLLWTLGCVWMVRASGPAMLPPLLLVGVMLLWGWRYLEWLGWFPLVLVSIAFVEHWITLPFPVEGVTFRATHLLVAGLVLVSLVRAGSLRRRLVPKTPVDTWLLAIVLLSVLPAIAGNDRPAALTRLFDLVVAVALFYAASTVASRPGGPRRVWPVFPAVMAVLGVLALLRWSGLDVSNAGPGLSEATPALLLALPVTLGLALDAGRSGARRLWWVAIAVGLAGLAHMVVSVAPPGESVLVRMGDPITFSLTVIGWIVLLSVARLCLRMREVHPTERPRWLALALVFAGAVLLQFLGFRIGGNDVLVLLATGAGLATGAWRVGERQRVAPPAAGGDAAAGPAHDTSDLKEAA